VAQDHQVDVHVHQSGHHAHALGVDGGGARGHRDLGAGSDGHDTVARNEHDTVAEGRPFVAVDDLAANEGQGRLGVGGRRRAGGQAGRAEDRGEDGDML
jgi:hypothetical protein